MSGKGKLKVDIWMPVIIGDILADTMHLTPAEFGGYMRILFHQWRKGHFEAEALQTITGITGDAWSIAQAKLMQFLSTDEAGLLYQARNDYEKGLATRKRSVFNERAKKAAAARWQREREKKAKGDASSIAQAVHEDMLEQCPSPSHSLTTSPLPLTPTPPERGNQSASKPSSGKGKPKPRRSPPERSAGVRAAPTLPEASATPGHPPTASGNGRLELSEGDRARAESFERIFRDWYFAINGHGVSWGPRDGRALDELVAYTPDLDEGMLQACLEHRRQAIMRGEFSPTDLPRKWLRGLLLFAHHPVGKNKLRIH
jgi:uncharacterized protein YdaU (DUF1376 family)